MGLGSKVDFLPPDDVVTQSELPHVTVNKARMTWVVVPDMPANPGKS